MTDDRQLARLEPEPRRVQATPDDVTMPGDHERAVQEMHKRLKASYARFEEELFYGYVGGQAAHEQAQADRQRQRGERIINQAIDWSNLRTPEADAPEYIPQRTRPESGWERSQLARALAETKDPALRRTLLEEYHREDRP